VITKLITGLITSGKNNFKLIKNAYI
jgi:hypothetical protein